jgi:hypothetical protein
MTGEKLRKTPDELVTAYAKEAAPLERRGSGGPEQLPSGARIMKLDVEGRTLAAVACYRALPRKDVGGWGTRIMLGLLATTLLAEKLPFTNDQLLAMIEHAAHAKSPALGPCDFDHALAKVLKRMKVVPDRAMRDAIGALMQRRGGGYAIDRKIVASFAKVLEQ